MTVSKKINPCVVLCCVVFVYSIFLASVAALCTVYHLLMSAFNVQHSHAQWVLCMYVCMNGRMTDPAVC